MTNGDRICLHDDMSDPSHAVAVAYNLSAGWRAAWGGATVFGDVIDKRRVETPWDSPIELFEWRVGEAARYVPRFNSLLVMWLDEGHAHGVEEVTSDEPRLSLIGIYARAESAGDNGRSPG